jgi:hypothetical protein
MIEEKGSPIFTGIMIFMNIDEDTELDGEYQELVSEAHMDAVAKGLMIVHAFERGVNPLPWFFEDVEGHTFMCPASHCGRYEFDFPESPDARKIELKKMAESVAKRYNVRLMKTNYVFAGECRIGDEKVLMPPFTI